MNGIEKALLSVGLAGWILLGVAHTVIVMTGPRGWRPDRSAPGAMAVVGSPGETDPVTVARVRTLLELDAGRSAGGVSGDGSTGSVGVVLPAPTDSADLLYTRYQLVHLLYPRRVQVRRDVPGGDGGLSGGPATVVVAPGVSGPPGCERSLEVDGYRLFRCGPP